MVVDKLYNCDCMEFMASMGKDSVDMTLTDIPYDAVNNNDIKARGGQSRGIRKIDKGKADILTFDLDAFLERVDLITKNVIVIFCGIEQMSHIFSYYKNQGYVVRQLIYHKTNPSPMNGQNMYLLALENAVWVKKKNAVFNGFCKSNVLSYPTGSSSFHPTEKNHELLRALIYDNTKQNDLVFDPCAGSGSSLLVAGQEGRHFLGCELHKPYYDKAVKRLKAQGGYVPQLFTE